MTEEEWAHIFMTTTTNNLLTVSNSVMLLRLIDMYVKF